jgi:hypothetical protein
VGLDNSPFRVRHVATTMELPVLPGACALSALAVVAKKTLQMLKRLTIVFRYAYQINTFKMTYLILMVMEIVSEWTRMRGSANAHSTVDVTSMCEKFKILRPDLEKPRNYVILCNCTIIKPVIIYASETWVPKEKEIRMLSIWERNILRKIYEAKKEGKGWKILIIRN